MRIMTTKNVIQVVYVVESDRHIYIKRNPQNNVIIELNWNQGDDDESLKECQCPDKDVLLFYGVCREMPAYKFMTEIDAIDEILWLWYKLHEVELIND